MKPETRSRIAAAAFLALDVITPKVAVSQFQGTRSSIQTETQLSDFERRLFQNGALIFNPAEFDAMAKSELEQEKQWLDGKPMWEDRAKGVLERDTNRLNYERKWRQQFSGQIQKHWDIWYNIEKDFEKSGQQHVTMSHTLVDAGLTHEHHLVANSAGKTQKLDMEQMARFFRRPDIPGWNRDQVIAAQRKMGVSDRDIQAALPPEKR